MSRRAPSSRSAPAHHPPAARAPIRPIPKTAPGSPATAPGWQNPADYSASTERVSGAIFMLLHRFHRFRIEPRYAPRSPRRCRCANAGPARPAICAISARVNSRAICPSNFPRRRQRDMVNIHVQPHADRIRRDQEINLAVLIHLDLFIAPVRGDSAPSTTAVPPRCRLINSAIA